MNNQLHNSDSKNIWIIPLVLTVLLTALVSLSIWNSVLVGDEEFVVFSLGPELANSPSKILSWALNSSIGGWQEGRFVSPLTHIFSNAGTWITYVTSEIFGVDVIFAYAFWRMLLLIIISILGLGIVQVVTSNNTARFRFYSLLTVAIVLPATMISNHPWAATRVSIWSYNLTLAMFMLFTFLLALIAKGENSNKIPTLISCILMSLLGILFSTTYELTQILMPAGVFIYLAIKITGNRKDNVNETISATKRFLKVVFSPQTILFGIFFIIPFLLIRISSYLICLKGCYQTASIKPGNFQIGNLISRWLSASPLSEITYALNSNEGWQNSRSNITFLVIFTVVFSTAIGFLAFKISKANNASSQIESKQQKQSSIILLSFGLIVGFLLSFGMAMSVAVQESDNVFGIGSRDTLAQNLGGAFTISGIFLLIASSRMLLKKIVLKKVVLSFMAVFTGIIIAFGLLTNALVTKTSLTQGGNFLQSRLAAEIFTPDLTQSGDARRCDLVVQKFSTFPDWEGHDRSILYGLNLTMQRKYGINFCNTDPEIIFANYSGGQ